ncbi:hypothetical protein QTG54_011897 [Skeletonema marinoi]|uniref:Uncharacterized protein n=1 Tax=Skeletonema marinoi TaxID=267567 RepID=A0AAD8Y2F4_9STRA|nr:hypothetical protein QTG54_011897 [Skeletonema marinoi]
MMNRQLLRTLRLTRRQWNCSSAANNAIGIHHHYNATRLASPLITNNVIPTTHHMKLISSASFSTDADSKSSAEKVGIVSRIRTFIKTIFGSNDDTPRGVQERKDMYWILLAVTHRKLRMEAQQTQLSSGNNKDQLTWNNESKEEIKQYMEEAVSYLDEQTDISEMPLRRLRQEIQSRLEPQIIQLLSEENG